MRGMKPTLMLSAIVVVGLAVWASAFVDQSGSQMATAANRFLAALDEKQKGEAVFAFDSAERLNWHFIPRARKGLPIKEMTPAQQSLLFGVLQTGLGASGYLKATTIMSLEQILRDVEQGKGPVRDPELYYVSIFGTPAETGRWGWRFEGHHLSLNFTLDGGKIVAATPVFFGANPAEVRDGSRKGLRTLADVEDRALRLVQALTDEQKKVAITAEKAPNDIRGANTPQPPTEAAEGISYGQLNDDQKAMLKSLVESYAGDMPLEVSTAWFDEIRQAGPDLVRFSWTGPADRTQPHAYKIQGPTFLIEFNNTQNNANHIHSLWRNTLGDFGIPVAAK
ncbi:DUF3500 domain-containing protein [Singulisphaera sp. PoT]|uniref:DUF3500 domain-containing protein n=1 Tax=Singulisphaera sp. PoT TaxID=3411797 RepID=UPI003BF5100D